MNSDTPRKVSSGTITVRGPIHHDEPAILRLLAQLGYSVLPEQLHERLQDISDRNSDSVLVATLDTAVVGIIALHCCAMLQHAQPVARITTLVVDSVARGKGVGRMLVEAGAELVRQSGCQNLELTTAVHRTEAHEFYKAMGFASSSVRFSRPLHE